MSKLVRVGVDVGSTTVKAVVLDEDGKRLFADYRRHNADVRNELCGCWKTSLLICRESPHS